jgi:sulfur carrier protein
MVAGSDPASVESAPMSREPCIAVRLNGESRVLPAGCTVAMVLAQLDAAGRRVAVERNGEIVPRSLHIDTQLADGDALEVVVAVGGG